LPSQPASFPLTELASQRKRTFIVPSSTVVDLTVTTARLSDDLVQLIRVVGQIADKMQEPKIIDWVSPNIQACSHHLETLRLLLTAVVEEQPNG